VGVAGDVGQEIPQELVDEPGRGRDAFAVTRDLRERDLGLVERVVPGLVDPRRLGGRADEQAREEIGDRGMPLPVEDQGLEQIRAAEEGAVIGGRPADDDVVAPARAGVLAVDHELVGAEAGQARFLVDRCGDGDRLLPVVRRVDVDLDHAGLRGDADHVEPRVVRRRVALHMD
jgi:hypothetical protein